MDAKVQFVIAGQHNLTHGDDDSRGSTRVALDHVIRNRKMLEALASPPVFDGDFHRSPFGFIPLGYFLTIGVGRGAGMPSILVGSFPSCMLAIMASESVGTFFFLAIRWTPLAIAQKELRAIAYRATARPLPATRATVVPS